MSIGPSRSVPPCASSKRPGLAPTAPVKAPFSYPKSSDSMRVFGMAAQLILMNGRSRRDDFSCRAVATSSLPVPLSPWISTVEGASATLAITCCSSIIRCPRPMISMNRRPS